MVENNNFVLSVNQWKEGTNLALMVREIVEKLLPPLVAEISM
jgi:hypothetical protein